MMMVVVGIDVDVDDFFPCCSIFFLIIDTRTRPRAKLSSSSSSTTERQNLIQFDFNSFTLFTTTTRTTARIEWRKIINN